MTPMPVNPTVVIRIDEHGLVKAVASNIGRELNVQIAADVPTFSIYTAGLPFNSASPVPFQQPLNGNYRKGKA